MEEFNYKFSQNCSILTLNGVSSLVTKIRSLHKSTNQNEFNKHYKYLREQCINPKHSVASSAMFGLINLTQEPDVVIPLHVVVKDVMSTIPNVQNMCGIIDLIFHALFKPTKPVHYDIMKNQHPLITVLKKNQNCWPYVLSRIQEKFRSDTNSRVLQKLQAFALFVLYDYEQKLEQILQLELLNIYKHYLDDIAKQKIIILNPAHVTRSLRYCKVLLPETPQMLTYVITAIYKLMRMDQDASEALWILYQHVSTSTSRDYGLEIAMIADCLLIAPVTTIGILCECVNIMLSTQKYPTLLTSVIKSCLLSWKMHFATTPLINENISGKIDEVLSRQFEHNDMVHPTFEYLDEKQYVYAFILDNNFSPEFIECLEKATPQILEANFSLILGLFDDDNETDSTLKALNICLKTCKIQSCYTSRMLPVLLHKISNTVQPDLHLALLRALPKMGVLKENLSTIVMTIKAISNSSIQMHAFAISLMFDLVLVDKICFPYLEELLLKDPDSKDSELLIAKSFITNELCRGISTYGLETHRSELAGFVSKALMRNNNNNIVIHLSFQALKYLCQGFDPYTTMVNLSQRFGKADQNSVIVGMCSIMGEIPNMPDISDQKCEEVVKTLFSYAENYPSTCILEAVYACLSNFKMEQIAVGFPSIYTHITNDNSILGSLAGACWVNLLQFGPKSALNAAADMLIRFIHIDMKTYKRNDHALTEGHGEPTYMTLTRDNILAAVAKFVRKNVSQLHQVDRDVYIQCLRILSVRYIRPLPPMDWNFLTELKDNKDMQEYIIGIAARQSSVSGSARRFTENYLKALTDRNALNEEVIFMYINLDLLCNTIQPVILKPFFKKTLKLGFLSLETSTKEIDFILDKINAVLKSPAASESNKSSAAEVLLAFFVGADLDSDVYLKLLQVVGSVPRQFINEFSPVQFETVNDVIMLRCLSLHCATATAEEEKPFILLDNLIDCRTLKSCVQPAFDFEKMFSNLAPVFEKHQKHATLPTWLSELTSKINIELAERKDMRNVIFSSTVFLIAIVVSSGYHIFASETASLDMLSAVFPFGLARLLNTASFAPYVTQILESLYDFSTNANYRRNVLSEQIARSFKHALLLMRSQDTFNEKFSWMKYVEVNF